MDALARAVADRLADHGGLVVLDSGATNLRVAQALPTACDLTVVTSSPAIGAAASANGVEVMMLGGLVTPAVGASVDAIALDALRSIRADVAVLGVCAVDPVSGISADRAAEVAFKRAVIDSAAELIVAPTEDKIGAAAPFRVSDIEVVTTLVTSGLDRSHLDQFGRLDMEILQVDVALAVGP
jgi:DeoR/GlpR family transcriptional regulator of sugar metabolism